MPFMWVPQDATLKTYPSRKFANASYVIPFKDRNCIYYFSEKLLNKGLCLTKYKKIIFTMYSFYLFGRTSVLNNTHYSRNSVLNTKYILISTFIFLFLEFFLLPPETDWHCLGKFSIKVYYTHFMFNMPHVGMVLFTSCSSSWVPCQAESHRKSWESFQNSLSVFQKP